MADTGNGLIPFTERHIHLAGDSFFLPLGLVAEHSFTVYEMPLILENFFTA